MKKVSNLIIVSVIGLLISSGCSMIESIENDQYGTLKISITDAPFPFDMIDSAGITITKVEARISGDSSDADFITLVEDTMAFNLLELRNGVKEQLGKVEVPAGEYSLFRLYVDEAGLKVKDGDTYKVKVPSGAQTGIKLFVKPSLIITGGATSELLIDFSLENSFILLGNINSPAGIKGFNFKPVIRAVNNSVSGILSGTATDTDSNVIENVNVVVRADTTVASAFTDSGGYYAISGLPAGTYTIFTVKEGYDTFTAKGIEIFAGNITQQDLLLVPSSEQ
ncbi:MAG: DUF4382 domain-containing protein [Bacteroidales bacterium]|nr:DUF4382 domain-containing protein [Bacteroidales bacterium]